MTSFHYILPASRTKPAGNSLWEEAVTTTLLRENSAWRNLAGKELGARGSPRLNDLQEDTQGPEKGIFMMAA